MGATIDRSYGAYAAEREAARAQRRGAELYPRLMVIGSTWVRQDRANGPMVELSASAVERLLLDQVEVA